MEFAHYKCFIIIIIIIIHEKGTPFVYLLSVTNGAPSTYLVENFASLLTAVNARFFFLFFYIEINLKNSMYTDVLFFYFVPTPLHWRLKNPLRFISYHPRSADFEKEIESLLTGHLKNRRFSRLFKAISFIY